MSRFAALLAAAFLAPAALAQQPPLPAVQLRAGMHLIKAEVADSFGTRMQGLMLRQSMGVNDGMLFVFDESTTHCMWMKNTLIPLAVAFMDDAGTIVTILEMQPHDEASRCATKPARYALEMNKGWFAQRGLKPGAKVGGLERLGAPRRQN
jgi:uncharacterized membrane protein (UPF0127 family)